MGWRIDQISKKERENWRHFLYSAHNITKTTPHKELAQTKDWQKQKGMTTTSEYPFGAKARDLAVKRFITTLEGENRPKTDFIGLRASNASAQAFWKKYRQENPNVTEKEITALQKKHYAKKA